MTNASTIPVKVSVVKKLAKLERDFQLTCLRTAVLNVAKDFQAYALRKNKGWWARMTGKFEDVPIPDELADKWYAEFEAGKLHWESAPGWKFQRTKSEWWQRLKFLEALPEETEDEIMMLSIEDAKLVRLNERWEKAQ